MKRLGYLRSLIRRIGLTRGGALWITHKLASWVDPYMRPSYGQTGEDRIISHLLRDVKNGFYIDVGCFHPVKFSNTFQLYKRGWNGINIDANQNFVDKFNSVRPEDTNICAVISDEGGEEKFYLFEERPAVSTIDPEHANEHGKGGSADLRNVKTKPLKKILKKCNIPEEIHFMDVDVEGKSMEAVRSMDFYKYRPWVICIEIHNLDISENLNNNKVVKYLESKGYSLVGYSICNGYFVDKDAPISG